MITFDRIKKTSKERGFTLTQVAERAGLGQKTIYKWKNQSPSSDKITAVADVLGVSVDYLLGNTDVPMPMDDDDEPKRVDIDDDDVIMTFEGRPIPPEDLELMRRLLRGSRDGK
jgi:transcriptional regulator with XRE-family HTH domain